MESSLQKIIAAIVGIMILFIIPVYIAFEKADDVSYNLVLKLSQNFVDNVRDKGYISPEMYSDFVSGLYATNNSYDVELEHVKKRIDPVIYIYEKGENLTPGRLLHTLDYATYYDDYIEDGEITIKEGVYNEKNAIIEENKPEISYNEKYTGGRDEKADGSISDYEYFIKFKEDNYPDPNTREYEFYKDYIQQYKEYGRIILSKGDIYADVETSDYDELIDKPARISEVAGQIIINNKQGNESNTLDYETYINKYDNARTLTLSDNTTSTFFDGPIYTQDIIANEGYMLPKSEKYANYTDEQANIFYNQHIETYENSETDKIIVYEGGVYADKARLSTKDIIDGVDKLSRFNLFAGTISIKNSSQIKNANGKVFETTLDYDKFIDYYDSNKPMVQFEGEIYKDSNSDIVVTKPAMWIGNKEYTDLTDAEKKEAETKYSSYIEKLDDGVVIFKEGEIYSEETSPNYDEITDTKANIKITGTIAVKNPTGWQPKELDFDKYIEQYRKLSDNEKLVVDQGGTFKNGAEGILIKHTIGTITDTDNSQFIIDYDKYINDILDDTKEVISVERKAVYNMTDEILVNFPVKITEVIKYESEEQVSIYEEPKILEKKNVVADTVMCVDIDEYLSATKNNKIIINGVEYDATKIYTGDNIISKQYIIEIDTPTFIELPAKFESGISTTVMISSQEQVTEYIEEYKSSNSILYTAPNKEYLKSELQTKLKYNLEKIEIYSETKKIYTFEEHLNETLYKQYYEEFYNTSNPGSITVEETVFLKSELTVTYDKININYGSKIITSSESNFLKYIDDYYTIVGDVFNRRIVIEEFDYATLQGDLNIQYPKIEVYNNNHSANAETIYVFTENDYYKYYEEYSNDGTITVQPARIYYKEDVVVNRAYIQIIPDNRLLASVMIYDNDTKYNYDNCLSEYEKTYKVTLSEPEWYFKRDIEVIHPYIAIGKKNQTTPIYKIYKYASIDGSSEDGNVNKGLYDRYTKEFAQKNTVTIIYSVDDVTVNRKYININMVDVETFSVITGNKKIYDNTETPNYQDAYNEWKTTGKITYTGARQYFAEGNQLVVTEPSIIVRDPNTNEIIQKYEGNYDFSLTDEEIYEIYNDRAEEFKENEQLVERTVTYINKSNCIMEVGHIVNEEVITDKQIVEKLFNGTSITKVEFLRNCMLGNGDMYKSLSYLNDNSYSMNEGDQIIVRVKNSNQTIASVFYSLFTANVGSEEVARIYVNYGGTIKNSGEDIIEEINGNVETEVGRIFKYTGSAQEVTLSEGNYEIQCWGASGGGAGDNYSGGKGAYAKATFHLQEEMTLYVYVGGEGTEYSDSNIDNGGYNGGGNSYNGFGGGGATDVRLKKGNWNDTESLLTRIIVAGGGGGSSKKYENGNYGFGGAAGTLSSASNGAKAVGDPTTSPKIGLGAVNNKISVGYSEEILENEIPEEENGALGIGGSVDFDGAGGGGAGYFGGSASHYDYAGGGGGLSYIYMNTLSTIPASLLSSPFNLEIASLYQYILANNTFKNISYLNTYSYVVKSGSQSMDNPLEYLGYEDMIGNQGNGYVIIKKK